MSKSPKKSDYKASASEVANAEIGQKEYARFREKYAPLLKIRAEKSQSDDSKTNLRGRANADVMQTLSKPSIMAAESTTAAGDMAEAVTGQLGKANTSARAYQNDVGADTLAKARQQAGRAQQGLSEVARLSTSTALAKAQAKQDVAQSKWNAAFQIGTAAVGQGIENYAQTGNAFTPGVVDTTKGTNGVNDDGSVNYRSARDIGEFFGAGTKRNF